MTALPLFSTDDVQAAIGDVRTLDRDRLEQVATEAVALAVLLRDSASGFGEERREFLKERLRLSQRVGKSYQVQLKRAQSSVEYFTRAVASVDADIAELKHQIHNT